MTLLLLAFLGGALTILSPCILPVLPFVFARADRPFLSSGLPQLLGMAATFALVAGLATFAGGFAVEANQYGRAAAMALLAPFGLALLFPSLAERLAQPLVKLGGGLAQRESTGLLSSFVLGVATGLLWAPCAGPILGLILTGAALGGASLSTLSLLLAYALGAATSLALALLFGGRLFSALKRSLGVSETLRRALGIAVLAAVAAIAFGLDTGFLARASLASTEAIEQKLLDGFGVGSERKPSSASAAEATPTTHEENLAAEGDMPSLSGAVQWLNSPPLSTQDLRGKVVVVDFWTYSCINCLRALPYVRAWAEKYEAQGLVVIGVHAPEFAFEKSIDNVRKAVADLKIGYPVAIDNDYAIWKGFDNQYWPAHYFIDPKGRIRHHHFGEGDYEGSEQVIRRLLAEAGEKRFAPDVTQIEAEVGALAPADQPDMRSPETYIGYERAEHFVSPGGAVGEESHAYQRGAPRLNEWGLFGEWTVLGERAELDHKNGGIVYRFHARDLHLVLGPAAAGKSVRFRVKLDGAAPGEDHGADTDAAGEGVVSGHRLYQLVRQSRAPIVDRIFEIEFLDEGVAAYAFTFG
ncbi:MAG TPA: cytochrome c biogenesis protein DipZ [Methylocystis sp.]|nr:cytochrome c biogenesis protein DipZ [Methylocystis sp.]